MTSRSLTALLAALLAAASIPRSRSAAADPDALRKIVEGSCVPNQSSMSNPKPCRLVDLQGHFAVLKDLRGLAQYLLISTDPITGIESPAVLARDAPNYWEYAWEARRFMDESAGRAVPRDLVGLAINSERARSQNQLHIHIDCVRSDVSESLDKFDESIGSSWRPLPIQLAGHSYLAMRLEAPDLSQANPFRLLAEAVPTAAADMGDQTLVVVATTFKDGKDGFYLLNDHVDIARGDLAAGEELLDHSCASLGAKDH